MSKKWWVHVEGPDDLYGPHDSMHAAMASAHAVNAIIVQDAKNDARVPVEYQVRCWATPIAPGDERTAHITDDEGDAA